MKVKPYDGESDDAYDNWRQKLVDANVEGEQAGHLGLDAHRCPYIPSVPEYNEWHRGRLRVLIQRAKQRRAA